MTTEDIQLSKALSWILRHGATKEGITVRPDGYVDLNEILKHRAFRDRHFKEDIERVVKNCKKKRFSLRTNPVTNALEIRANQGHTLPELGDFALYLKPITEPDKYKTVVHGTYKKCWHQIKQQGLSRMNRLHIHFTKSLTENSTVPTGIRSNVDLYIFIDLNEALNDGIPFFESENGVVLTPGNEHGFLLPKYFSRVIDVKSGKVIFP